MAGKFLTTLEVEERLKALGTPRKRGTLAQWRRRGGGPPFTRFGLQILYPEPEFEHWYADQRTPTVTSLGQLRTASASRKPP